MCDGPIKPGQAYRIRGGGIVCFTCGTIQEDDPAARGPGEADSVFVYKCRFCGKTYDSGVECAGYHAMQHLHAAVRKYGYPHTHDVPVPQVVIHKCDELAWGIADLVGCHSKCS